MNNYDYIIKLLNFQDNNSIKFKKIDFENNTYFIFLEQLKIDTITYPKCGETFNQPTSIVSNGYTVSNQLKESTIKETTTKQSFKDIANKSNVAQSTKMSVFRSNMSLQTYLSLIELSVRISFGKVFILPIDSIGLNYLPKLLIKLEFVL